MPLYPESIDALVKALTTLPGIGHRSAMRIALHIIESSPEEVRALAETLWKARKNVRLCQRCGNYAQENLCALCLEQSRDNTLLCVVERASDIINFEKTKAYRGRYHILGGKISPIKGVAPQDLALDKLIEHINAIKPREVIIATGADIEGQATASVVTDYIKSMIPKDAVTITRLGFGLPVGAPLEFADEQTIQMAMDSRHEIKYT